MVGSKKDWETRVEEQYGRMAGEFTGPSRRWEKLDKEVIHAGRKQWETTWHLYLRR